jgi:hypothetical protein
MAFEALKRGHKVIASARSEFLISRKLAPTSLH